MVINRVTPRNSGQPVFIREAGPPPLPVPPSMMSSGNNSDEKGPHSALDVPGRRVLL